jgi:predicted HicB family RNase H-like nuclease
VKSLEEKYRKIRIDPEDYHKLEAIAERLGTTVDALVIEGLENVLIKHKVLVKMRVTSECYATLEARATEKGLTIPQYVEKLTQTNDLSQLELGN